MSIEIILENASAHQQIPTQQQFQNWANAVLQCLPTKKMVARTELNIRIIDKTESAYLNETYRHKSGPTNILSFYYNPIPGETTESLGDIAICADLVTEEAHAENKTPEAHWTHLTVHGILHLLGYDHEIEKDAKVMEHLEIKILQSLGIPNPYLLGIDKP